MCSVISRCFSPFCRSGPRLSSRARTCRYRGSAGTRTGVWCCVCDGVSSPPDASRENLPNPPEPARTRHRPYYIWYYHEPRHTRWYYRASEWRARWSSGLTRGTCRRGSVQWAWLRSVGVSLTGSTALALSPLFAFF